MGRAAIIAAVAVLAVGVILNAGDSPQALGYDNKLEMPKEAAVESFHVWKVLGKKTVDKADVRKIQKVNDRTFDGRSHRNAFGCVLRS